jgi:hypothetical protein
MPTTGKGNKADALAFVKILGKLGRLLGENPDLLYVPLQAIVADTDSTKSYALAIIHAATAGDIERAADLLQGSWQTDKEMHAQVMDWLTRGLPDESGRFEAPPRIENPYEAVAEAIKHARTALTLSKGMNVYGHAGSIRGLWQMWPDRLPQHAPPAMPIVRTWDDAKAALNVLQRALEAVRPQVESARQKCNILGKAVRVANLFEGELRHWPANAPFTPSAMLLEAVKDITAGDLAAWPLAITQAVTVIVQAVRGDRPAPTKAELNAAGKLIREAAQQAASDYHAIQWPPLPAEPMGRTNAKPTEPTDAPKKTKRKRGRPADTDTKSHREEKKVYDAWNASGYTNYLDFATKNGMSALALKSLVERVAKREKRRTKSAGE